MSESDKLACFMQAVIPLTKVELVIKEVKTSNCPNQNKTNRYKNFAKNNNNAYTNTNRTCRKCNQKGHYANSCRSAIRSANIVVVNMIITMKFNVISTNQSKIMSIEGFFNNIKMNIGLDCGATNSIINYNTAVKNNILLINTNVTADSSLVPV